jgi:hypothetical protein
MCNLIVIPVWSRCSKYLEHNIMPFETFSSAINTLHSQVLELQLDRNEIDYKIGF